MKKLFLFSFLFTALASFGNGIPDDLPRQVSRELKKQFGKNEVVLAEENNAALPDKTGQFFRILSDSDSTTEGYLHYGRVKTCRAGGCALPGGNDSGTDSEYFDYLIVFGTDASVQAVKIYNYQASYGHEIAARGWLKQFRDFTTDDTLDVGKNIDGISGATVSVHAITDDVQWKTQLLKEMILSER
ncbi:FMN-binding domain-containing protein [Tangfeifania diversioriginum]|uniref:FMN-binding domain-containing protein n=1 Tax=Tangfeifania diversioriginum TaxID=1168035 RepID=A0A1M6M014_9BACT|nr:FMN-binding protein [Tangfeifania diversioriginum]SHJ76735.1 FMN-binding domain-containing protein [Tangfeifania diversioriginum]